MHTGRVSHKLNMPEGAEIVAPSAVASKEDLQEGLADLVAFGRPFIANPDLVERFESEAELAVPDQATFYAGGSKGYVDYPTLQEQEAK